MTHRKLSEREKNRIIDIYMLEPLEYLPYLDDELIRLGLLIWSNEDEKIEVVHNPKVSFYDENGKILTEWY